MTNEELRSKRVLWFRMPVFSFFVGHRATGVDRWVSHYKPHAPKNFKDLAKCKHVRFMMKDANPEMHGQPEGMGYDIEDDIRWSWPSIGENVSEGAWEKQGMLGVPKEFR